MLLSLPLSVRCQCEEFFRQLSSNDGWELGEVFGFGAEKRGRIKTSQEQEVLSPNEVRLFPENLFLPTQKKLSLLSRPTALRSNGTQGGRRERGWKPLWVLMGDGRGRCPLSPTLSWLPTSYAHTLCCCSLTHAAHLLLTQKCSLCSQGAVHILRPRSLG